MILATGAGGIMGSYLPNDSVIKTDRTSLDVTDLKQVCDAIKRFKPDGIIHLAAETDGERCEKDPNHAYRVNVLGTENVALACMEHDIPMVYVSSGSVFDGRSSEPYTEFDAPNPINVYGRAKLEGEKIVQTLLKRFYIVRTGWVMGGVEKDKKFVGNILRYMEHNTVIKAVDDKFGNMTYARDLVQGILYLFETRRYGLYHMAGEGVSTRYEIACYIAERLKWEGKVVAVSSAHFPFPPRARWEGLRNFKLQLLGWNMMRPWQEAVDDYLQELGALRCPSNLLPPGKFLKSSHSFFGR